MVSGKQVTAISGVSSKCRTAKPSHGRGATIYVGSWAGLTPKSPTVQITVAVYTDTSSFQRAKHNLAQGLPGPPAKVAGVGDLAYEAKGALSAGIHVAVGKVIASISLDTVETPPKSAKALEPLAKAVAAAAKTPTATPAPAANDTQWTEFGHDDQSTKQVVSTGITTANVGNLHQLWTVALDGELVAEPLYYSGNVYAASEGGDVVAIDAQTGTPLWKQTTPTVDTTTDCGTWGISSTPVIDPARNRIYVAAADGMLYAYDLDTGAVQPGFPFRVVRGPSTGYVWGALRLLGSNVLVGVASHCDEANANGLYVTGQLAAYDIADAPGSQTAVFQTVPLGRHLGGIWGYSGSTISTDGHSVYTGVGNAAGSDPDCSCEHDDWGYGDSIVQLSTSLAVTGSNNPGIPANGDDDDWGAAPALFTPDGCRPLAAASNKNGYLYVYQQNAIDEGPIWSLGIGVGEPPLLDSPAWSPSTNMFYIAGARMPFDRSKDATGVGIVAVKVSTGCKFSVAWTAQTGAGQGDGGSQSPPIVVGGVVFASGGNNDIVALDAQTGRQLWQGQTSGDTLASPSEAAGMLFAPNGTNVEAWGP